MAVLLTGWLGYGLSANEILPGFWQIMTGSLALMAISWFDDLKNLSAKTRLVIQVLAVVLGFWGLHRAGLTVQLFHGYIPLWLDHLILGLAWIWLINLYNFMDGIDGISGIQTISITFGLICLAWQLPLPSDFQFLPLIVMASTAGFLIWNWEPASIFLGDVGSIPLGYILGWFFLLLISQGLWAAAFILPLYYLCDATFTLIKRLLKKQKIWQAHREHCYQKAVQNGASHKQVALVILGCNIGLLGIAVWFSQNHPWPSLASALILVSLTMIVLLRKQSIKVSGKPKP